MASIEALSAGGDRLLEVYLNSHHSCLFDFLKVKKQNEAFLLRSYCGCSIGPY